MKKDYTLKDFAEMAQKSISTTAKKNVKQIIERNKNEREYK